MQAAQASTDQSPASEEKALRRPLQLHTLPAFPAVALELMDLLDQPECSVHAITAVLRREPALAAEVLKVSNSARYFRHKEEILDLDTALVVIGLSEARRVALNAAIRGMLGGALGVPELRLCWSHCIAVALICEEFAGRFGRSPGRAYVAGLLHDLGMLALLSLYPVEYRQMVTLLGEDDRDWRTAERSVFGWDHEQVGAAVADQMSLPASLKPILSKHHDCSDFSKTDMLTLVALADHLAVSMGYPVGGGAAYKNVEDVFIQLRPAVPMPDPDAIERLRQHIESVVE